VLPQDPSILSFSKAIVARRCIRWQLNKGEKLQRFYPLHVSFWGKQGNKALTLLMGLSKIN
jgi:hypothetical protein